MQPTRHTPVKNLVLKMVAIAVAAAAVYAADSLPDRARLHDAHAAAPAVTAKAPPASLVATTEVWSADESAAGTRPDASH